MHRLSLQPPASSQEVPCDGSSHAGNGDSSAGRFGVLIPMTMREIRSLSMLLGVWRALQLRPQHSGSASQMGRPSLLLCVCTDAPEQARREIQQRLLAFRTGELFEQIRVETIEIPPEEDCYYHDLSELHANELPRLGLKSGPNRLFFEALRCAAEFDAVFLNECDCFPIRSDWLDCLQSCSRAGSDSVVIGSHYKGAIELGSDIRDHLNGNAIYNLGHPLFRGGLCDQWEAALAEMCRHLPDTAHDILFARLRNIPAMAELASGYELLQQALHQTREVAMLHNASLATDASFSLDEISQRGAVIVHGKHFQIPALERSAFRCPDLMQDIRCFSQLFMDGSDALRDALLQHQALTGRECASGSHHG